MGETATKKTYPFGFYVCNLSFTFERLGYYAIKWLIVYFIAASAASGGIGLTKVEGGIASSWLVALTYIAPIFGGIISDRWIGARYCIPVGMVIMGLGYVLGGFATGLPMVYAMIVLVAVGTGLFKGNVSAVNGKQFNDQKRLDSAFSIQYTFVNIGSFIGTSLVGVFTANGSKNFTQAFVAAGIVMFIGAIWFALGGKSLGDIGKKPFKYDVKADESIKDKKAEFEDRPLNKNEKQRIFAIILVSIFSIVFWLFWYLAYLPVYDHWQDHMNWTVGGFDVPTSWFDSLNAFLCMLLGPLLAIVWYKVANRPKGDMSMFKKTALGLILLGVAFAEFALADVVRGSGQAHLIWIVIFGIFLTLGEMVFSPLGNSFVTKYAPAKYLSVMMGVWTCATFIAGISHGYLYAVLVKLPFAPTYFAVAALIAVCGIILWAGSKKLDSLTN